MDVPEENGNRKISLCFFEGSLYQPVLRVEGGSMT